MKETRKDRSRTLLLLSSDHAKSADCTEQACRCDALRKPFVLMKTFLDCALLFRNLPIHSALRTRDPECSTLAHRSLHTELDRLWSTLYYTTHITLLGPFISSDLLS